MNEFEYREFAESQSMKNRSLARGGFTELFTELFSAVVRALTSAVYPRVNRRPVHGVRSCNGIEDGPSEALSVKQPRVPVSQPTRSLSACRVSHRSAQPVAAKHDRASEGRSGKRKSCA